jgi:uncharacterized membrane protein YkvA (DUF1232 family)
MKDKKKSANFFTQNWRVIRALFDKRTPWIPKAIGILIICYAVMPFDLIPDAPFIGWLDDATVAALGLFIISKLVPVDILEEHTK